jgi:hypothetical protein
MFSKRPKYGNKRTARGFASRKEEHRFDELALLEMAGRITDLRTQVTFKIEVNGFLICRYVADFVYVEEDQTVVEDVKGFKTDVYKLKRKLMAAAHGVVIRET